MLQFFESHRELLCISRLAVTLEHVSIHVGSVPFKMGVGLSGGSVGTVVTSTITTSDISITAAAAVSPACTTTTSSRVDWRWCNRHWVSGC